jgi:thioredoxin-like negative regulator of GroEL
MALAVTEATFDRDVIELSAKTPDPADPSARDYRRKLAAALG